MFGCGELLELLGMFFCELGQLVELLFALGEGFVECFLGEVRFVDEGDCQICA